MDGMKRNASDEGHFAIRIQYRGTNANWAVNGIDAFIIIMQYMQFNSRHSTQHEHNG
jgi:hypothetical protein